jgi:hypothetical protein
MVSAGISAKKHLPWSDAVDASSSPGSCEKNLDIERISNCVIQADNLFLNALRTLRSRIIAEHG